MRVKSGYNQTELAKKLNIGQTTLSGYETEATNPCFEMIERISNQCNFDIVFIDRETKEQITTSNINRKDIC